METRNNIPVFGVAVPVGKTIKDCMVDMGFSQKDFAAKIGMQPSHLTELLKGRRKVTPQIALQLERVLGIKADVWLHMQAQYDCNVLAIKEREEKEQEAINSLNTYDEIIHWRLILKRTCPDVLEKSYMAIAAYINDVLQLPSAANLQCVANGLFKKSTKTGLDNRMLMTWIVLAQLQAKKCKPTCVFDKIRQEELIQQVVQILHQNQDTIHRIKSLLNQYGIGFSVVEKVEKASIDGFTYWDNGTPNIVVSCRYNRIDNFAFTILHELGHIFLHPQTEMYIRIEDYESEAKALDEEADEFANNSLIPKYMWATLPSVTINAYQIQSKCTKWAQQNNYNKWIVLGRVSYETGMYKFKQDETRKIL